MDLRQLRAFVAVAEELHFARAAARLNVSQQPLSVTIKRLEQELDATLFNRTTRRVELTPAGRVFLNEARQALTHLETGIESARRAQRGLVGRLSVAYVGTTLFNLMPPAMRRFREDHPEIEVQLKELSSPEAEKALLAGSVQLAFLHPQIGFDELDYEVLTRERAVVVMPRGHPLERLREVPVVHLAGERMIGYSREVKPAVADQVVALCREAGFSPTIVQEADTDVAVIGLVTAGVGVSLVPACLSSLRADEVSYRPVIKPEAWIEYAVATRRADPPPAAAALRNAAREAIRGA